MSLKIEIDNPSVKIGDEIPVKTLLTNNTDQVIQISKTSLLGDPCFQYMVDVEREDHAAVVKKYVEKIRRHEIKPVMQDPDSDGWTILAGSVIILHLPPGKSEEDLVHVSNRYEFDKPGNYFVQAEYELPESLGGGFIKSNIITITVTP